MSAREAMAIGTAGYTAMLAVMALERHGLDAGKRSDRGHRRGRRRRLGRDRDPRQARLCGPRGHRPAAGGRLPQRPGRRRDRRAQGTGRPGQAAGQGALGGRDRCGRFDHAGQPAVDDPLWRGGRRLWACRRHGPAWLGRPVHFARGVSLRHRFGDVPARPAPGGLETAGNRPGSPKTGHDDPGNRPF